MLTNLPIKHPNTQFSGLSDINGNEKCSIICLPQHRKHQKSQNENHCFAHASLGQFEQILCQL